MEADSEKMCGMAEAPNVASASTASFNFAEFDFLDMLPATTTPPRPTAVRRLTTPYKTPSRAALTMPAKSAAAATKRKRGGALAQRIASVDELVKKLRLSETERDQFAAQLHDFQSSAGEIQTLYEDEKRQRQQLASEHKRVQSECARIDAELAHRTLKYDQLQAQWDEFNGGPLEYGALAVRYLKLTQKLDEAKLLHWSEQALVQDIQKYCKLRSLSVPVAPKSPAKKRKRVYKSEKSVQCELWRQEPATPSAPPPPPPAKQTRDQFTQHISTTTTRSTSTACFIKQRSVATSFPERLPLPPLEQMLQELQKWNCVAPVSPINDLPLAGVAVSPASATPLPTLKTQGTCTWLCNIQREIDFLPPPTPANLIKRSNSRPSSRLAFDACGVKHEVSTTPPPVASPTAPTAAPPTATSSNTTPNTSNTTANFLQFSSASALSHLSPAAFEQLWQVFGQMLLGLLQPRNSGAAASSLSAAAASDALSQQEFHNWMRSLYDNMQHQPESQQPDASGSSDGVLHRPQARHDVYAAALDASNGDTIDDDRLSMHADRDHPFSPHHQSIGTSPIHFEQPEEVHQEEHEHVINHHSTFISERNERNIDPIPCIYLPPPRTEYAYAFQPHLDRAQMPPPPTPTNVGSENVTDEILKLFPDGNDCKEKRKAIKKLLKRSNKKQKHGKTKKSKKIKYECGSYMPNAEVEANETAVDFLATLGCFKVETPGEEFPEVDATEEFETRPTTISVKPDNIENIINTQNCGLKKSDLEPSTLPEVEERQRALCDIEHPEVGERRKELRDIEHSLFGSDTDLEDSDDDESKQMRTEAEISLPNLDALVDTVGIVVDNKVVCDKTEYNKTKTENLMYETDTLIRGYRNSEKWESDQDKIKILTAEKEQIPLHAIHETTEQEENSFNVSVESNTSLGETSLELVEERNREVITDNVESNGELKEANKATVFKTTNVQQESGLEKDTYNVDLIINEEPEETGQYTNSVIEISSEVTNAANELDDRNYGASPKKSPDLSNEVVNTIDKSTEVISVTFTKPNDKDSVLIKPLISPNKHASTLLNSSTENSSINAKFNNKCTPTKMNNTSELSVIEISSEMSGAIYDKTTTQCANALLNHSESAPNAAKDKNVLTKLETDVNTETPSPRKHVTQPNNFTAISPIKDSHAVALMLQNNEHHEQVLKKFEEIANSSDEIDDETASMSALIDTNLFNELLADSATNLVVDEMFNEAAATSPSNAASVEKSELEFFDFTTAINELEEENSCTQIVLKKRGRKRKSESVSTSPESNTNPVVCKRSERLRAKQLIVKPYTGVLLSPVILGKYTKRQNGQINEIKNIPSKFESLKPKSPAFKTQFSANDNDDEDNVSLQINLGFFKERLSNETTPMILSPTASVTSNTKLCDNLLDQQVQEEKSVPTNMWCSFGADRSIQIPRRLGTPNGESVRQHFQSYQCKAASAQTIAILKPTNLADSNSPTTNLSLAKESDDTAEITNIVPANATNHVVESLCMLTVVCQPQTFTQNDFVAYDEPPASPTTQHTAEPTDFQPRVIPVELDAKYQPRRHKQNSVLQRLVDVYSTEHYRTINNHHTKQELEQRTTIETQLKEHIHQFLDDNRNTTTPIEVETAQLVCNLLQLTRGIVSNTYDPICTSIVEEMREVTRPEHEIKCALIDLPPNSLSKAHQRITYVMRHLQYQRVSFASDLMAAVEAVLFNVKNADQLLLEHALNLTQLYLLAAGQLSLAMTNPARLFIAKCLYFHKLKSMPMIYEVLCRYPTVLPHRDDRSYDRSDALITVIQHTLMCNKYDMDCSDLRPKELLSKLRFEYHFEAFKPERAEVVTNLVEKLKAGRLTHLKYAFAVFCKRMRPSQAECLVLQEQFMPLANDYYARVQQSFAHDPSAAALLDCISMVVKPFPVETNVSPYLDLFARFLNVVDRPLIQEAAVQSVLRLQRFNTTNCYNVLVNFVPSYELQPITKAMLKTFIHRKPLPFWKNCGAQARIGAEHES